MTLAFMLEMLGGGALALAIGWALSHGFRAASAGLRRLILLLGFGAALASPVLSLGLPEWPAPRIVVPSALHSTLVNALVDHAEVSASGALPSASVPAPTLLLPSAGTLCLGLWLGGVVLLMLRLFVGVFRASALVRAAQPLEPGVRVSDAVEGPVVVGLLSPMVILPLGARDWSEERREIVLLHEKAHVRRRDGLGLAMAQLACAVYWFHPLAWLGVIRLRRQCELYADEAVVASGVRASRYAEHLLELAREMRGDDRRFAGAFGMAARPSELGRRIQILLSRHAAPPRLTRARSVLAILGALALLAVVTSLEAAPEPGVERAIASPSALAAASAFDAGLQRIAEEEAARARQDTRAARVAAVILDTQHGRVLAMADDEPGRPIPVASTLKPLTIALALDGGHINLDQRFDCGSGRRGYEPDAKGPRVLQDVGSHGWLDAGEILAVSSNIGTSRIFDALGGAQLVRGLARFQLEAPPRVEDRSLEGAMLAMGARLRATPLELAAAYGVLAHDGLYPSALWTSQSEAPRRVIASSTARTMRSLLAQAVYGDKATGRLAQVPGVRVAGKTGTTDGDEHVALFAGMLPAEAPRFVIVVAISEAKQPGGGATLAAPVFARIGARALRE